MNNKIIAAALLFGTALTASAQNYTDHLEEQRAGQGTVKIVESSEIDKLVNATAPSIVAPHTETTPKPATHKETPTTRHSETKTTAPSVASETSTTTDVAPDTRRKVMRGQKVTGYRVQVYSGGNSRDDKNKAQRVGNAMKEAFPTQPVFVHFYSPRWVCRIGNFVERSEANECLRQVRALGYTQACIVKGTITVKDS